MQPAPWSHSRLEDFKNCPRAFSEKTVYKTVKDEKGEATIWGERVHKHFEERLVDGVVLPAELETHENFLAGIERLSGDLYVEQKIALNTSMAPCEFFGSSVWFRGVIDVLKVNGDYAVIWDHKTGKHHNKFGQLKLFALHTFAAYPDVEQVRPQYYWTQTKTTNGPGVLTRDMIPSLWQEFLPDLKQYAEAFKTETWQPRQSGLCGGWCPVTTCEFWREKRRKN